MWTGRTTCLGQAAIRRRSNKQMTSNQRRPGFRLPWASESEAAEAEAAAASAANGATKADDAVADAAAAVAPGEGASNATTTDATPATPMRRPPTLRQRSR
jgi:hypothetical protein